MQSHPASTINKRKAFAFLLLIYPRLISLESDRGSGSTRHGWRKERCQPWIAVSAIHFHDHSEDAAGTRRAELSQKDFLLPFVVFSKMKAPDRGISLTSMIVKKHIQR